MTKFKVQTSKLALWCLIALWFVGAALGMAIVIIQVSYNMKNGIGLDITSLDSVLNYIGVPMTGGVLGYLIKSALENTKKIDNGYKYGIPDPFANHSVSVPIEPIKEECPCDCHTSDIDDIMNVSNESLTQDILGGPCDDSFGPIENDLVYDNFDTIDDYTGV